MSEIPTGIEREQGFTVADRLLTDVGGTIGTSVLSTPGMIGMMEWCSTVLVAEHLPENSATVGFEVCVKHVAAALEGSTCIVRATLREVIDDRKLRFDVEVVAVEAGEAGEAPSADERTIGVGTHERRVITVNQLG